MDPPPYGQAPIAEKTDPLSRQISNLLLSTAAKSALDRKELFPTHDDWLLFDIANERLITNKTVSNSVRGGGVYLVVSSAAAAQNMLHEIARRYISEEVLSKAKSGGGYLAPIWGRISGGKVQGETGDGGDVKAS
jgi:hypothetical protein